MDYLTTLHTHTHTHHTVSHTQHTHTNTHVTHVHFPRAGRPRYFPKRSDFLFCGHSHCLTPTITCPLEVLACSLRPIITVGPLVLSFQRVVPYSSDVHQSQDARRQSRGHVSVVAASILWSSSGISTRAEFGKSITSVFSFYLIFSEIVFKIESNTFTFAIGSKSWMTRHDQCHCLLPTQLFAETYWREGGQVRFGE
jgi:hypothetical protein